MNFHLFNQNSSKTDSGDPIIASTEGISEAETTVTGHQIILAEKNQYVNHCGILTLHFSVSLFTGTSIFSSVSSVFLVCFTVLRHNLTK